VPAILSLRSGSRSQNAWRIRSSRCSPHSARSRARSSRTLAGQSRSRGLAAPNAALLPPGSCPDDGLSKGRFRTPKLRQVIPADPDLDTVFAGLPEGGARREGRSAASGEAGASGASGPTKRSPHVGRSRTGASGRPCPGTPKLFDVEPTARTGSKGDTHVLSNRSVSTISITSATVSSRAQSRWSSTAKATHVTGWAPAWTTRSRPVRCASSLVPPIASTTG
jgi:hypothetical protein